VLPTGLSKLSQIISLVTNPIQAPDSDAIWKAYEAAQKHHDSDLTLFNTRTNLFLVVETALITVATAGLLSKAGSPPPLAARIAISCFGVALSIAWLTASVGAYNWTKEIRIYMVDLGKTWTLLTSIQTSSEVFARRHLVVGARGRWWRHWWRIVTSVRPTLIFCVLPFIYILGWIALPFTI
jgi:hypothetical protein